jgi:RimJ/RimL family protein N-acetyltransferase
MAYRMNGALETPRLRLRPWTAADRAPFAALNADPRVMAFFPAPLTRAQSDAMADRCEALVREHGWGPWAVEAKADGAFIGCVGLHVPSPLLPFSPCVEVLWRMARAYWGQGLASEAAAQALRFGFETLGLEEIVAFTTVGNRRSRAVMERMGMHAAGTFAHPLLEAGSPLLQHALYRLRRGGAQA